LSTHDSIKRRQSLLEGEGGKEGRRERERGIGERQKKTGREGVGGRERGRERERECRKTGCHFHCNNFTHPQTNGCRRVGNFND
jgi:hypothetical protein